MANFNWPVNPTTVSNASVGLNGGPAPTSSTEVGGIDPSGNLQPLQTDSSGNLKIAISAGLANPLPVQDSAAEASLASIDTKTPTIGQKTMAASSPVVIASDQSAVPASQSGTWNINNISGTVSLPTGAATSANQTNGAQSTKIVDGSGNIVASVSNRLYVIQPDVAISGTITTANESIAFAVNGLGSVGIQATGTFTGTIVIEGSVDGINYQSASAINVSTGASVQSFTSAGVFQASIAGFNTFRVRGNTIASGTITINIRGNAASSAVSIASALPLPSGAATAANQVTGNASLSSIDGKLASLGQKAMAGSEPVVIASDQSAIPVSQSGTWNINNISGTVSLPTGAATAANQTTANTSLSTIATNTGNIPAKGQTTMSGSTPVAIASDQSAIPIAQKGLASSNAPVQNLYTTTSITTSAYTQLIASTTSATTFVDIFDSSGQAMILATGGSGSEVIQAYIPPGGDSFYLAIPAGTRVAYKALTANATSGYLLVNLRG